jgi:hypothetical protein
MRSEKKHTKNSTLFSGSENTRASDSAALRLRAFDAEPSQQTAGLKSIN